MFGWIWLFGVGDPFPVRKQASSNRCVLTDDLENKAIGVLLSTFVPCTWAILAILGTCPAGGGPQALSGAKGPRPLFEICLISSSPEAPKGLCRKNGPFGRPVGLLRSQLAAQRRVGSAWPSERACPVRTAPWSRSAAARHLVQLTRWLDGGVAGALRANIRSAVKTVKSE